MSLPFRIYLNDVGGWWEAQEEQQRCIGGFDVHPYLVSPSTGRVRTGLLAAMADMVGGILANVSLYPRIPFTTDLSVHLVALAPTAGTVDIEVSALRVGRSTTVLEAVFATRAAPFAIVHLTFMPSPRPEDVMEDAIWKRPRQPIGLSEPIFDAIKLRLVEPGRVELDREQYVLQPSGTLQGGAVALLAERAAESLGLGSVTDMDIRYLAAVRVGPGTAVATHLGQDVVRVEVRDPGNADRLATLVTARVGGL